jgi:hypothetical protein
VPLVGVLYLTAMSVLSVSRKRFWVDEWLSYYLLNDSSFTHMLEANADLINASLPLYFMLGWLWAQALGTSELSLRLFTSLGFSSGFVMLWWTVRRAYGIWPAAVAVPVTVFANIELHLRNMEARFYGLYFAEIAAAIALFAYSARRTRTSVAFFVANALVHAALVTTHYFGFVYSGAVLLAYVLYNPRPRWGLALNVGSVFVGWLAFLPWIPAFLNQRALVGDEFWVPNPDLPALFGSYDFMRAFGFTIAGLACAALVVEVLRNARRTVTVHEDHPDAGAAASRRALVCIAVAFLLVPVGTWFYSQAGTSLFLRRYMFPTAISYTVLVAYVAALVLARARQGLFPGGTAKEDWGLRLVPNVLLALLVGQSVLVPLLNHTNKPKLKDMVLPRPKLPVVVESPHAYFNEFHHLRFKDSYYFLSDPEFAPLAANATTQKIMAALVRQYPASNCVLAEEFLANHRRFLVVTSPDHRWFELRLRANQEYECKQTAGNPSMYFVSRRGL